MLILMSMIKIVFLCCYSWQGGEDGEIQEILESRKFDFQDLVLLQQKNVGIKVFQKANGRKSNMLKFIVCSNEIDLQKVYFLRKKFL